jgi:methyl-accepting chemotaxis protein
VIRPDGANRAHRHPETGRGFAVASEVKALANQTGKATEEIGDQIVRIQEATREAVTAIQGIAGTIGEIDQIAAGIASAVEEQSSTTLDIARNVQQAATGTQEVSSTIADVKQAATDTGAAASHVLEGSKAVVTPGRGADRRGGSVHRRCEGGVVRAPTLPGR